MAASDPYFRFPLCALSYGQSAFESLDAIIPYAVVSAGIGAKQGDVKAYRALVDERPLAGPPTAKQSLDRDWYEHICAGAVLTKVSVGSWRATKERYSKMSSHCEAYPKSALVTIKAEWVWNALETALQEEGQDARNPGQRSWMTWREFRVLCAVLSVIGAKSFAWASTNTLIHRVCGYTSAAAAKQGKLPEPPAHCPPMTRWMLEGTLNRLEELRFFLRVRVSKSPTGRGGHTAYSIRHDSREALINELRTPKYTKGTAYRKADHSLWTQMPTPSP